ncbi:MAG: co-chaperone GroES [Actinobacteria bacterium]|nr:co-chaperone GroES [Actinomycetota bacterium]
MPEGLGQTPAFEAWQLPGVIRRGTVVAVGPGRFDDGVRVPMDIKVGDVVLYSKYGGTEIKHGGEEYLVLSARDILAVIAK